MPKVEIHFSLLLTVIKVLKHCSNIQLPPQNGGSRSQKFPQEGIPYYSAQGICECGGVRLNSNPKFMIYTVKKNHHWPGTGLNSLHSLCLILLIKCHLKMYQSHLRDEEAALGIVSCPRPHRQSGGIQLQVYLPTKPKFFPPTTLPPQALLFVLILAKEPQSLFSGRGKDILAIHQDGDSICNHQSCKITRNDTL